MNATPKKNRRLNFVFFIADQWRGDVLGHAGNPAALTPHLDKLVQTDAVSFTNTFCQNTVCTPSRCSFMTGWYPHSRGHRSMNYPLQPDEPCLLSELRCAGYYVWWGGKNDLVSDPDHYAVCCDFRNEPTVNHANLHNDTSWLQTIDGKKDNSFYAGRLDKHADETVYLDADWADVQDAISFLESRESDQPFCLFLNLQYPHPPYGVEDPYFSLIDRSKLPPRIQAKDTSGKPLMHTELHSALGLANRTESWWNELRATYYGMCTRVDEQAHQLLQALQRNGLYDDTAFFLFADHGDYAGDYDLVEKAQNLFEDCLTRVPFIVKPPRTATCNPGIRSALVELVDFPATVYEMADITPSYDHFGKSVLPLLAADAPHRDVVFTSGGRLANELHCSEKDTATPNSLYLPRVRIQTEIPAAHGKGVMCRDERFKLVTRIEEGDELYDLQNDPGETINQINNPDYQNEYRRLAEKTLHFLIKTADVVPRTIYPRDITR